MGCHCPVVLILRVFQLFFSIIVLAVTSNIAHKFSEIRQLNDDYDPLSSWIRKIIDLVLSTPHRIYLGMIVSTWTIIATLYLIFVPRWRNAKFAPHGAIIGLEITTTIFWLCASIGLALFAAEVEPICLLADEVPIIRKVIENCITLKIATALAALSWLFWFITSITMSVQACRSRRDKSKAPPSHYGLVTDNQSTWTPAHGDMSKPEQGVFVTTVEMLPRYP